MSGGGCGYELIGPGSLTSLQDKTGGPALQPQTLYQLNLSCSGTHPLNPLHRIYNLPNTKRRKMLQVRVGESSKSFNNNKDCFNVNYFNSTDERAEILEWLSPLEPRTRHDGIRAQRVKDVGDWLLRTEKYRGWFDGIRGGEPGCSALFCYGAPGVGKTHIR